jgi:hypothetical protein
MLTTASDWFESREDFMRVCLDALSQAKGESAEEFVARMLTEAKQHGLDTPVSDRQMRWLCNIADALMPPRRAKGRL